jgi:hypothetical protein
MATDRNRGDRRYDHRADAEEDNGQGHGMLFIILPEAGIVACQAPGCTAPRL